MATAAQTISNPMKLNGNIPRVDLAKIDNVPYYIESEFFIFSCHLKADYHETNY
jgi:hypothetical protein